MCDMFTEKCLQIGISNDNISAWIQFHMIQLPICLTYQKTFTTTILKTANLRKFLLQVVFDNFSGKNIYRQM